MLLLAFLAVLTGILTAWVTRRTTDARRLRETRNRIEAHLLEFRLFFDEPGLIWQAQLGLLRQNLHLLRLLWLPTLLLAAPMAWLFVLLDAAYGLRPLRIGDAAVVTAQLARPMASATRLELRGAEGIVVETPPIRLAHDDQVAWRIRATRAGFGAVNIVVEGIVVRKTIVAGDSRQLLSARRSRSLGDFLLHPEEARLPDCGLAWVALNYPEASPMWMVWFVVISTGAALISFSVSTPRGETR